MNENDNPTDEQTESIPQEEASQKVSDTSEDETLQVETMQEETMQEVTVESLQAELAEAQAKVLAQQEDVLRAQAEVVNMRRRADQDVAKAHKFGQEKLVQELLGLVDNLERAINAGKADNATLENLLEGVAMSQTMLLDGLKKFNVEQLDPHGEPFDPAMHEAMTAVPNPELEPNTVMEVFQKC